jgi:O-antigen/teichoic acid export membrane protein
MGLSLGKSNIVRGSAWSLLVVSFRAIAAVVINKVFSVYLGAAGLTLLSHFQNLTVLFTLLPAEGVNKGIIKYWSDPEMEGKDKRNLFNTALWLIGSIFTISLVVLYFWFKRLFFEKFIESYSHSQFLLVFIPAVFLMIIAAYLNAVLLAKQRLKAFGIINIIGTVLLIITVCLGVLYGNMDQALLSLTVGYGLVFLCVLIYFLANPDMRESLSMGMPDVKSLRRLGKFMAMAITAISLGKLLDFVLRDYIMDRYGLEATGLWQSVVKMSLSYTMLFTSAISFVYYPRVCALIHNPVRLRQFVFKSMGVVATVSVLGLGVYYFNRTFFLAVLFDESFTEAAGLVRYQVIGDFFGLMSFLLSSLLSAQAKTTRFIISRFFSAVAYLVPIFLLIDAWGVESLPLAHLYRQFGLFIILLYFNRQLLFLRK